MPGTFSRIFTAATAAVLTLTACTGSALVDQRPRSVAFSAIREDDSLIGSVVRVHACIGIPLSTVEPPEEFVPLSLRHRVRRILCREGHCGVGGIGRYPPAFADAGISSKAKWRLFSPEDCPNAGECRNEPSIILEVNDRTIRVWMQAMVFLKEQVEVAGVMRADFKDD